MTKARDLANFTASTGVVDADIGSTVQAYDSNLTSFVNAFTLPTTDGTSGQVVQTNGSGTLSFATPSSGAVVWLATATANSSASLTFTSTHITSTYDAYMIVLTNILLTNNDYNLYVNCRLVPKFQNSNCNDGSDSTFISRNCIRSLGFRSILYCYFVHWNDCVSRSYGSKFGLTN